MNKKTIRSTNSKCLDSVHLIWDDLLIVINNPCLCCVLYVILNYSTDCDETLMRWAHVKISEGRRGEVVVGEVVERGPC